MADLTPIDSDMTAAFARALFEPLACVDFGVTLLEGATRWEAHESGEVNVASTRFGELTIPVGYDRRGAPYALASPDARRATVDDAGTAENPSLLLSLADENATIACAWARRDTGSPLLGVGIDLVDVTRFERGERSERLVRLLFSDRERELCREALPQDPAFGHAVLFGIKEAAFKACAAQLRTWERTGDELPVFEVRHFAACELRLEELLDSSHLLKPKGHPDPARDQGKGRDGSLRRYLLRGVARGDQRDGAAQAAMDCMGIDRIETYAICLGNLALVVATALRG